MFYHKVDEILKQPGQRVSDLELAARICVDAAARTKNLQTALAADSCALRIRALPNWTLYSDEKSTD